MVPKPIVVLGLVLTFSLAARSGDAKNGDTIQGAWLPSTAELGGKMFPTNSARPSSCWSRTTSTR
jgi:hypothetical protein